MTARPPIRPVRARSFAAPPDDHDAHAEVQRRRDELRQVQRLARDRKAGPADVSNAEYKLHLALQRVDSDGWTPPSIPSIADDDLDEPEPAA